MWTWRWSRSRRHCRYGDARTTADAPLDHADRCQAVQHEGIMMDREVQEVPRKCV